MTTLQRRTGRAHARLLFRFAAVLGLALAAGAAWATGPQDFPTNEERDAIAELGFNPNDPLSVTAFRDEAAQAAPSSTAAAGDIRLDTSWNPTSAVPGVFSDRFAGPNDGVYEGMKAAMLPNGNTVIASKVTYQGHTYLGLTQMSPGGVRVAWTNPNPNYAAYNKQYILYPKNNASRPGVFSVKDLKVYDNRIWALVTDASAHYAPTILCFYPDGGDCGYWVYYANGNSSTNDAVAMDILGDHLVVLGRHSLGDTGGFWTVNFKIDSTHNLTNAVFTDFPTPPPFNNASAEPADVAFENKGVLAQYPIAGPRYYVLFTYKYTQSLDHAPCVLAVNGNGTPATSFPRGVLHGGGKIGGGAYCRLFTDDNVKYDGRAVALTTNAWGSTILGTYHQGIEVLLKFGRAVKDGAGMWEFLDNADHPRFGTNGAMVFGGCGRNAAGNNIGENCPPPPPFIGNAYSFTPTDLEFSGNDEIVSGSTNGANIFGGGTSTSPTIYRIHGDSGAVEQHTSFPSGYDDGWLNTVVARDAHHLVGVGEAIDHSVSNTSARTMINMGLTNLDDTIFKNGFD